MFTITEAAENPSRLLGTELFKPAERLDDAVRVARAIAELMDPEWREFVEQEQREHRVRVSSLGPSAPTGGPPDRRLPGTK
jgi:hypothetical protein